MSIYILQLKKLRFKVESEDHHPEHRYKFVRNAESQAPSPLDLEKQNLNFNRIPG